MAIDMTLEQTVDLQAEMIRQMQDTLARLQEKIPLEEEAPTGKPLPWPKLVWKRCKIKPDQIDHPGSKCLKVKNQIELDAALRDNWRLDAYPPVYPPKPSDEIVDPEPEEAPPHKKGSK